MRSEIKPLKESNMPPLTIYHNPRCSKSRQTLALVEAAGVSPTVVLYLQNRLDSAQIKALLDKLGFDSARDLMRRGEADYKALGLRDETDEAALIRAMVSYPKLIERPIVSDGTRAVLGRPPENVNVFLP